MQIKTRFHPPDHMDVRFESSEQNVPVRFKEFQQATVDMDFETDNTLKFENGILSVNTTDMVEQDNTLPITSAGVYTTVGNIEVLLKTI